MLTFSLTLFGTGCFYGRVYYFGMTGSRNGSGSGEDLATVSTLLTCGKTGGGTGSRYCGDSFLISMLARYLADMSANVTFSIFIIVIGVRNGFFRNYSALNLIVTSGTVLACSLTVCLTGSINGGIC